MKILILSAFPEEQNYYKNNLEVTQAETQIGFVKLTTCRLDSTTIYLATTGMGTPNAALTLASLTSTLELDAIFFSGTSGAVQKNLKIGDVVIATEIFDADILSIHDNVIGTPFESALINPNILEKTPRFYPAHPALLACTKEINSSKYNILHGRIASSNHFPSPKNLFEEIKNNNAMVIDMESSAIYQFAWLSKIPTLVVRGVSNTLDEKGDDSDVANSDLNCSDHAAEVVLNCIKANIPL
ncbi:MAG: 5'-methylthioadenosine/S-adenosylhomocysteine nucleosidase [Gammaproteobacteria bacterium]|nr:5'-methylthioadenosine/S-adenosylhomocysteine nucleosidase [Gammaproteobacteria bacterium]